MRGDANYIRVGERTNIQDGTIIHVDYDAPTIIAEDVTVGHQCMLHGCKIEKGALIGMSSIVLNHAVIGENSLIGAGSLVTQGTIIPPNVLAFGRPAKVIRPLTEEEIAKTKPISPIMFPWEKTTCKEICLLMASEVNRISFMTQKPACFSTAGF